MDKALEKINELKQQLEELYTEYKNNEDKIGSTIDERATIYRQNERLYYEIKDLKYSKNNIQYKLTNIKKWKRNTILKTIFLVLFCLTLTILVSLGTPKFVKASIFILVLGIPGAVLFGESGNYYLNKKYLKQHKLEDVEKELNEKNKKLEMNYELINKLDAELKNLLSIKENISNNINFLEDLIKKIKTIRATVIENYLENNPELDTLINNEFDKENNKQLIKKDSNK